MTNLNQRDGGVCWSANQHIVVVLQVCVLPVFDVFSPAEMTRFCDASAIMQVIVENPLGGDGGVCDGELSEELVRPADTNPAVLHRVDRVGSHKKTLQWWF